MKESARRVAAALAQLGMPAEIIEFSESTRTAEEAAAAVQTTVGQIVKSLVFLIDDQPVLALVSGSNRLDLGKLALITGGAVSRANAAAVREATGYAIGGVPPIGHATPLRTFLDQDLMNYPTVWAAAGTPNAVFKIDPAKLVQITGATIADLCEQPPQEKRVGR